MFTADQIAMLAAALAQGNADEGQAGPPAYQQRQQHQASRRQKQGHAPALYNEPDPEWQVRQGISLLAAAADEIQDERPAAQGTSRSAANPASAMGQVQDNSLDDIANQIMSAFPEFAELLHQTRLQQPAAQQPAQLQPQQDHQLDAAQQALLQQLIMGVTQQDQEQNEVAQQQQLALQLQEQLVMQQKQEEQVRLHLQRQQQMQQQQKQFQALQQQQDLEMLLLQQQRSFADASDGAASGALAYSKGSAGRDKPPGKRSQANRASLQGQSSRQGQLAGSAGLAAYAGGEGMALPAANAAATWGRQAGSSSSSRPAGPPHPGAYVPTQHLPGAGSPSSDGAASGGNARDAAAAAALDEALAAAAAAAAAMPAQQGLLQQHQSALLAAAAAARIDSSQQQQRKAGRARRAANDDPDASMSSAPSSDSAMDDDADDDADDDDDAARRSSGDAAVALPAGPMSRRALLGLPPVGLGQRHQRLVAGQASMAGQVVKPKPPKNHHAVFVWDLDESLILLHSLVSGKYAAACGEQAADGQQLAGLAQQMQRLVLQLADDHLFFKQLEGMDLVHVGDVWRLAAQYAQRRSRQQRQQQLQDGTQQHPEEPREGDKQQQHDTQQQQEEAAGANAAAGSSASCSKAQQQHHQQENDKKQADQQQGKGSPAAAKQPAAAAAAPGEGGDAMEVDEHPAAGKQQEPAAVDEGSKAAAAAAAGDTAAQAGSPQRSSKAGSADGAADSERDSTPSAAKANGNSVAAGAAAAGDDAPGAAPAAGCVVAGSPSTPAEPELLLRPYRLGPKPDTLKELWQQIQKVYDAGSGVLPLSKAEARAAEQLWEELDAACSGWLRAARSLLQQLSSSRDLLVTHVLVGNSQLVPLLGKLMLFKLDSAFDVCDVYSASSAAKMGCFKRIAEKYGPKARYIVLGDGPEEEACAEMMEWPFVRITLTPKPELPPQQPAAAAAGRANAAVVAGSEAGKRLRLTADGQGDGEDDDDGDGDDADDDDGDDGVSGEAKTRRSSTAAGAGAAAGSKASSMDGTAGGAAEKDAAPAAGKDEQAAAAAAAAGRRVRADALGSAGHPLVELTAQQLLKLALSMS